MSTGFRTVREGIVTQSDQERIQLESLWRTSAIRLRRFLCRMTGDLDVANDLLSQTFLEAARSWRRHTGKGSRQAWLFGIARNLASHEYRRLRQQRTGPLVGETKAPEEPDETVANEETKVMEAAIQELPVHLRVTLMLRLTDDLAYEEVAGALGIPIGTVRSRLHEAVCRLRDRVKRFSKE